MNSRTPAGSLGWRPSVGARPWRLHALRDQPGRGNSPQPADNFAIDVLGHRAICVKAPIVRSELAVTPRWAALRYLPHYFRERRRWGNDYEAVVGDLVHRLLPEAGLARPTSGAELELRRRIHLATAILFACEGTPVYFPPPPRAPRPWTTVRHAQPWMRALMTGWP